MAIINVDCWSVSLPGAIEVVLRNVNLIDSDETSDQNGYVVETLYLFVVTVECDTVTAMRLADGRWDHSPIIGTYL
jgi:hypothetical protein